MHRTPSRHSRSSTRTKASCSSPKKAPWAWLLPHVRRQQRRPLDRQASLEIRPIRQLRTHRRRHQRHLTHLPHHRRRHRRHRPRSPELGQKNDAEGKTVKDANGDPILEQAYSVETGTILTINIRTRNSAMPKARNSSISPRHSHLRNSSS